MAFDLSRHVGCASPGTSVRSPSKPKQEDADHSAAAVAEDFEAAAGGRPGDGVNYVARAQWLRAAVLGANDGLVSVASLMIGVGAVNNDRKTMLVSGLAGLVAGACSMAIGEFVSVYAQCDIQAAQIERARSGKDADGEEDLPSPTLAAVASALSFAVGAALPLVAGGLVPPWEARIGVVCAVSSLSLAGFGVASAYLGGASMARSGIRMLMGGWLAMAVTYGVLKLFRMHDA